MCPVGIEISLPLKLFYKTWNWNKTYNSTIIFHISTSYSQDYDRLASRTDALHLQHFQDNQPTRKIKTKK